MATNEEMNKTWFKKWRQKFRFTCTTATSVSIEKARGEYKYGQFIRAQFEKKAWWGFKSRQGRDAFVKRFSGKSISG